MTRLRKIEWILGVPLGGFFIWSGGRKLLDLGAFVEAVGNFKMEREERLGEGLMSWFEGAADVTVAYSMPWLEIFAGLAVLSGVFRAGGVTVLLGLLGIFNLALLSAWDRGIQDLKCGCHGVSDKPTDYFLKVSSNFGLMVGCLLLLGLVVWQARLASRGGGDRVEV